MLRECGLDNSLDTIVLDTVLNTPPVTILY